MGGGESLAELAFQRGITWLPFPAPEKGTGSIQGLSIDLLLLDVIVMPTNIPRSRFSFYYRSSHGRKTHIFKHVILNCIQITPIQYSEDNVIMLFYILEFYSYSQTLLAFNDKVAHGSL